MIDYTKTLSTDEPVTPDSDTCADIGRAAKLRRPGNADAYAVYRLIKECPPLDLNSVYTYLLLSEHFSATCVAAECDGLLSGFASAYVPPGRPTVLFVWQVAVHSRARGRNLGRQMLADLLQRPGLEQIQFIETTVGPGNAASRGMFAGLAQSLNAPVQEQPLFDRQLFGDQGHEDERLIRIGPFNGLAAQELLI